LRCIDVIAQSHRAIHVIAEADSGHKIAQTPGEDVTS
jgi:hypothetical protein